MRLPRWFRHWIAKIDILYTEEQGGVLFDYANGKWNQLHVWADSKTKKEVLKIVEQWRISGRDEIYVAIVHMPRNGGGFRGVFQVICPKEVWQRFFSGRIYDFVDAHADALIKCRELATKLGYRSPSGRNHTSSNVLEVE